MRNIVAIASLVAVSACAKDPDHIAAVTMDDNVYARQGCAELVKYELQQTQLLAALSSDQKQAQTGDAWGVFLLGLPVSSMSGSDKETEIAVAKGRIDAIRRQKSAKNCK